MSETVHLHNPERYKATRKVTLIGAVVNILLAAAQLTGGFLTHSHALIADGVHTLSDLASDFIVLIANRHAHRKADDEHPYGHGKIETLATSVLGMLLLGLAGGLIFDIAKRLLSPEYLFIPTPAALLFAGLAVVSKEGLYQYTVRVARKVRSSLLEANAWHHRSDVISSLLVIVGIAGNLMGIPWFDAAAAVAVAIFVGRIGFQLLWRSSQELIDSGLDPEVLARIEAEILAVDGVQNMYLLRTRKSGGDAFADVHIQVGPKISVSEGHQIAEAVRHAIVNAIDEINDVTIHTDPEDDATAKPCDHLPLRSEMLKELNRCWRGIPEAAELQINAMHYLDGELQLELIAPLALAQLPQTLQQIEDRIRKSAIIGDVKFLFAHIAPK